jgi:hypothetical protein
MIIAPVQYNGAALAGPRSRGVTASGTKQGFFSRLVFLLVDLAAGEALVQDAERVIGPDPSRCCSNRPQHEPDREHNHDRKDNEIY